MRYFIIGAGGEAIAVDADPAAPGAALNQGAREVRGSALVFVRDAVPPSLDLIVPALDALAAPDVGVATGILLSPTGEVEEAGLVFHAARLSFRGFNIFRQVPPKGQFCDAASLRFLATPRALFDELRGFDEALGETFAAVDYALRAREAGRRSVVLPALTYTRTEPELTPLFPTEDRDLRSFAGRWRGRAFPLENAYCELNGFVVREDFIPPGIGLCLTPLFTPTIIDTMAAARAATERRGHGYLVFKRADTQLEPDALDQLIDTLESGIDTVAVERADGTTIVAPRLIPQHLRLRDDLELADAVREWIGSAEALGRCVRRERGQADARPFAIARTKPGLTSIVTLSWNAPEYTEVAIASIRQHTHLPYEIIVVDNGSRPDTVQRIAALPDVRVIYNVKNTGFAYGSNQGMAAARGSHVVVLNNDVIVTKGWLESLLDVQRRRPTIGVSAPRSNSVVGDQQLDDATYKTIPAMHDYAAQRRRAHRGAFDLVWKASGFCLCFDRRVLEEVGGFDPRYGLGNFEDDDLCIRVRAAGYEIAVCHDSFIHHFGSTSFKANGLSYAGILETNQAAFLKRWELTASETGSWNALPAIWRGFVRERDFVPLPAPEPVGPEFTIGGWT